MHHIWVRAAHAAQTPEGRSPAAPAPQRSVATTVAQAVRSLRGHEEQALSSPPAARQRQAPRKASAARSPAAVEDRGASPCRRGYRRRAAAGSARRSLNGATALARSAGVAILRVLRFAAARRARRARASQIRVAPTAGAPRACRTWAQTPEPQRGPAPCLVACPPRTPCAAAGRPTHAWPPPPRVWASPPAAAPRERRQMRPLAAAQPRRQRSVSPTCRRFSRARLLACPRAPR